MSKPNLLFVCIDCLREDFLNADHADTPFIRELAERGTQYTNMFATTTTTTPSVASFMTGTYSERNDIYSLETARLNDSVPTLAEHLSVSGYSTHALVTGPLVAETNLDRGFDTYSYRDRREELVGDWFDKAVRTLTSLPEPFFLYLHLWEIHTPINTPEAYDDPTYGQYPYARMLSALDRQLEAFCDYLPSHSIIALHGDHGEAIAYRNSPFSKAVKLLRTAVRYGLGLDTRSIEQRIKRRVNQNAPIPDHFMEDGHGENVFDFVSNVPFVVAGGGAEQTTVEAQVRQVDVMPTLLDVAGVDCGATRPEITELGGTREDSRTKEALSPPIDGESLFPPENVEDRDVYMRACGKSLLREKNWQRAVRANGWKYVEYPEREWDPELYDLTVDPLELNPVSDERRATRLRARLPKEGESEREKLEIDGLLEDLGYK